VSAAEFGQLEQIAGVAGTVALLAWAGGYAGIMVARRPPRLAADPRWQGAWPQQPPAVAALLVSGWTVPPRAITATILDLAARGYLEVSDDGTNGWLRVVRPPDAELVDHERVVLRHVIKRAATDPVVAGTGWLPLGALTLGPADQAKPLRSAYVRAVRAQAYALGLATRRAGLVVRFLLRLAVFVAILAVLAGLPPHSSQIGGEIFGKLLFALILGGPATMLVGLLRRDTATRSGRDAASAWLAVRDALTTQQAPAPGDRRLGYAVALGVRTRPAFDIVLDQDQAGVVWSNYGGRWRQVTVRRSRLGLFKGNSLAIPLVSAACALPFLAIWAVLLGSITASLSGGSLRRGWPVALLVLGWALWLLLGGWLARAAALALYDLVQPPVTLVGQVVYLEYDRGARVSGDVADPSYWFVAVDDGTSDTLTQFQIAGGQYRKLNRGATVCLTYTPKLRYVKQIEVRAPTPAGQEFKSAF
jgi:Predicted membrane protein (DUF2207) C-terminal domain